MEPKDGDKIKVGEKGAPIEREESIGQILQAARLAQVMSLKDISRQLRLSERQVIAIEEDDYSKFQSPTFLRGFIRNYAKLVKEDSKKFAQLLQENLPPSYTQSISYPMDGTPFRTKHAKSKGNIIIILIIFLISFLLIYEVYRAGSHGIQMDKNINNGAMNETTIQIEDLVEQGLQDSQNELSPVINPNIEEGLQDSQNELSSVIDSNIEEGLQDSQNELSSVIDSNIEQGLQDSQNELSSVIDSNIEQGLQDSQNQSSLGINTDIPNFNVLIKEAGIDQENNYLDEEQKVEEKLEAEKEYSLRFVFTGESWVEVKDIQGNKILSRINPSNTEKIVYGIPPFSLIIGNAVDVKLFYNNKPVDLIPYTNKNGGVARLSLD